MIWVLTIDLVQVCQVPWQVSIFDNVKVELVPGCQSSQSRPWESGQGAYIESGEGNVNQPKDDDTES